MTLLDDLKKSAQSIGSTAISSVTKVAEAQIQSLTGQNNTRGVEGSPTPSIPDMLAEKAGIEGLVGGKSFGVSNALLIGGALLIIGYKLLKK